MLQEADGRIRVDANASLFSSQYAYNGKLTLTRARTLTLTNQG